MAQVPPPRVFPGKDNAERIRWLRYRMVAGRVVADSHYPVGMNISFGPTAAGRRREQLQLLILKQHASVRYELNGDGQLLAIDLDEGGELTIRRSSAKPPYAMQFLQQPGGLQLSVTEGTRRRTLRADSFWHLYLADPQTIAEHLIPYLELLRPSWHLADTGDGIEEMLLQRASHPQALDTRRWQRLVDQLGSAKFSDRESAQRELLDQGQVVLPFLERLSRDDLDAEQGARLDELVERLSAHHEDTTDRVATWLAADQGVWLSLLGREAPAKRRVAIEQLERLTGAPVAFDVDTDRATREAQRARLLARYAEVRGIPPEVTVSEGVAPEAVPEEDTPVEEAAEETSVPPPGAER